MKIAFEKYHGTGNDFILVDIRNHAIPTGADIIAELCDRSFGIGADGLIMLDVSEGHDFDMRYFNADGRESTLCGNGGRCITAFARKLGIIETEASFSAKDGIHHSKILQANDHECLVSLSMADVVTANWTGNSIFLDTGSPHLVQLCSELQKIDVYSEGKKLRNDPRYGPAGTNVNFIESLDGKLNIRTYERGVEDETLSCGTGVTAAAIGWAIRDGLASPIQLHTRGGNLKVSFNREGKIFTDIQLEGPASYVFSGQIEL